MHTYSLAPRRCPSPIGRRGAAPHIRLFSPKRPRVSRGRIIVLVILQAEPPCEALGLVVLVCTDVRVSVPVPILPPPGPPRWSCRFCFC